MKLIATPVLVLFDDTGVATLKRGTTVVRLNVPFQAKACIDILQTFKAPGLDPKTFLARLDPAAAEAVSGLIEQMKMARFLVPDSVDLDNPETVFWMDYGQSRDAIEDGAKRLHLTMVGRNHLTERVAKGLTAAGLTINQWIDDPKLRGPALEMLDAAPWREISRLDVPETGEGTVSLIVATTDIGAETHLRPWNEFCVDNNLNFLPISLKDHKVAMGPYVRPFENACLECTRGRINANVMTLDRNDEEYRPEVPHAFGWHPMLLDTAVSLATVEILRQAVGALPAMRPDHIIADPIGTGTVTRHGVLRLPRCPVCSPIKRHSAPMVVDSEDRNAALINEYR